MSRLLVYALLCLLLPGAALAAAPEGVARARPPIELGVATQLSRFGTSYETVYQLNLEPEVALGLGPFMATAVLPISAGATYPTFCCRHALGNATGSLTYATRAAGLDVWSGVSASAPTSQVSNGHAGRLAATAAILRDAGYYAPDTTTLRADAGAALSVTPLLRLGGSVGAHYWLRDVAVGDQIVVPLSAYAALNLGAGFETRAWARSLVRLLPGVDDADEDDWLGGAGLAAAYEWSTGRVEASLALPLDESLRSLGLVSLGFAYVRRL